MNYLDIYKLLNKSNCRECGLMTCMAFAHAVSKGERHIGECPYVDDASVSAVKDKLKPRPAGEGFAARIEELREKVLRLDYQSVAGRLGARVEDGHIIVQCLGREFRIDQKGYLVSRCHVSYWMETILFHYLTSSGSAVPSGNWVGFDRLQGGPTAEPYFRRRCEEPLRTIADSHTEIFFEILHIFGGRAVGSFGSDRAIEVRPVPMVPFLVVYTVPEEGMESHLKVLFDRTADTYLPTEVITFTGRGIVQMLQKIIPRHQEYAKELLYL